MLSAPLRLTSRPPLLSPRRAISSSSRAVRCYWSGLECWRAAPLNEGRAWGPDGPRRVEPLALDLPSSPSSLAEWGSRVLSTPDPLEKAALSHAAFSSFLLHNLPVGVHSPPPLPARPPRPPLVTQKEVPSVKNSGLPLNAYLFHGLAHVELNAIDLAWDTMVRFSPFRDELGDMFFSDFARVADDESRHFLWCSQRISELGFSYGDMPAHNLLWRECERSSGDVAARLAVIPLVQNSLKSIMWSQRVHLIILLGTRLEFLANGMTVPSKGTLTSQRFRTGLPPLFPWRKITLVWRVRAACAS